MPFKGNWFAGYCFPKRIDKKEKENLEAIGNGYASF